MGKRIPYTGKPHAKQTADLWENVGRGFHFRLRTRPCGEMRAVKVCVGPDKDGPHRDAGQIMLTPKELAEFHTCFKGGCGLHGWRTDMDIINDA